MIKAGNPNYSLTNAVLIILGAAFFTLDRHLKSLAAADRLPGFHIGQWLSLQMSGNENIAFSLPFQGKWLEILIILIIITLTVAAIWQTFFTKSRDYTELASLSPIIIFGAISNLIDRFQYGYVIDYIYIKNLIALNIADVLISVGAALAVILLLSNKKPLYR